MCRGGMAIIETSFPNLYRRSRRVMEFPRLFLYHSTVRVTVDSHFRTAEGSTRQVRRSFAPLKNINKNI